MTAHTTTYYILILNQILNNSYGNMARHLSDILIARKLKYLQVRIKQRLIWRSMLTFHKFQIQKFIFLSVFNVKELTPTLLNIQCNMILDRATKLLQDWLNWLHYSCPSRPQYNTRPDNKKRRRLKIKSIGRILPTTRGHGINQ